MSGQIDRKDRADRKERQTRTRGKTFDVPEK